MHPNKIISFCQVGLIISVSIALMQCVSRNEEKIPITTHSDTALENYLLGRDLFEKLEAQESIRYFKQAIIDDPEFALAYFNLSLVLPSAKEFFETFDKAKALINKVSTGERLWIQGFDAGVNGYLMKQREYYKDLVDLYPGDERARNLLGNHYFGQQEYEKAIDQYNRAIKIAPEFSQSYNQLGYAYRFLGNYPEAEKAFKQYVQMIPNDPNPYDSYGELLMKIGKYDLAIEQYKKALTINPNFVASHIGIATNYNKKNNFQSAKDQLQLLMNIARNSGERRAAYFAMAVSYVYEGNYEQALETMKQRYMIAAGIDDAANKSSDMVISGNILMKMGKYDEALVNYERAMAIVSESNLSTEVMANNQRNFLFNSARVASAKKDFTKADILSSKFQEEVNRLKNPNQTKLSHELEGLIALQKGEYKIAIEELFNANLQNPYNLYRISQAYKYLDERQEEQNYRKQIENLNPLNNMQDAFVSILIK